MPINNENTTMKPLALVIEDDDVIAKLIDLILVRDGFTVTRAADGREGLRYIEAARRPDLILLDVMLPFVSGFDVLRQVRLTAGWEKVPLIMLTAKSQEADIVNSLDAGASDYIVKPFKPNELIARIKRLMRS